MHPSRGTCMSHTWTMSIANSPIPLLHLFPLAYTTNQPLNLLGNPSFDLVGRMLVHSHPWSVVNWFPHAPNPPPFPDIEEPRSRKHNFTIIWHRVIPFNIVITVMEQSSVMERNYSLKRRFVWYVIFSSIQVRFLVPALPQRPHQQWVGSSKVGPGRGDQKSSSVIIFWFIEMS